MLRREDTKVLRKSSALQAMGHTSGAATLLTWRVVDTLSE